MHAKGSQFQDHSKHTSEDTVTPIQKPDQPYKGNSPGPTLRAPNARRATSFLIQPQLGEKGEQESSLKGEVKFEFTAYSVAQTESYKRDYLNQKRQKIC